MGSIAQLKQNLTGGGARPNRFSVQINFPAFAGSTDQVKKTQYLVKTTQLPSSTIGIIEQPYQGRILKIPGDRTYEEWTVTFVNDTDFALRDAFEKWHNYIISAEGNVGDDDLDQIFSTAIAKQLNRADDVIKEYTFEDLWPTVVGPIELAQDQNNVVEEFEVTFAYSQHITDGITS